ncbi:hypothetical protein [Paraburkholderia hospita]|uniref:hypothetical protein n=1 Tax=Paraburkholderia hospita TaxID=169430 RepID=UPI0013F16913|nr:hypothetical protein [Paraburkholderia hospita]
MNPVQKAQKVTGTAVQLSMSMPDFPSGIDSQKNADEHCGHRKRFIKATGGLR